MKFIPARILTALQKDAIFHLWNNEYSEKIALATRTDLDNYLDGLSDVQHLLLANEENDIKGWAASFTREDERWFVIILDSSIQKQGWGKQILEELKAAEPYLCGWVTDHNNDKKRDGTAYLSPLEFYLKNGFTVSPGVRLELEKISAVKIVWKK